MSYSSSDRPNGGWKDGQMVLLHCSGGHFLGSFSTRAVSSLPDIDLDCVSGVEGSPMEVSICQAVAWAGPKMTTCYYFLLLCCSGEPLLEAFPATADFSGCSSRLSFVPALERNSVGVVV